MWLLILEALFAGGLFVFIVWWTMFSGRRPEEPPPEHPADVRDDDDKPR